MKPDIFQILIEVVPPAHSNPEPILANLERTATLPITGFNIATNPVAKPRLSALALSSLIQQRTGKPAVLHITPRDHNRLALQSLIWGADSLGINTVLITSGDKPQKGDRQDTSFIGDLSVFDLIQLSKEAGLQVGVAFTPPLEAEHLHSSLLRMEKKIEAGAAFAITQPTYQIETAQKWAQAFQEFTLPVYLGILPLRSQKHALFMDRQVAGIHIPAEIIRNISQSPHPSEMGLELAQSMLQIGRELYQGVCLMPPFQQYHLAFDLLET